MAGTEIANAYVALTVKMDSPKRRIEDGLAEVDAEGAGAKISDGVGKGITNKQAAIAGAFGGIFASVTNMAAGAIGDLFGDAVAQSDSVDKFRKSLDFSGFSGKEINAAADAARAYADSTVYDLDTIQKATATFAANGVEDYSGLTEAAGNLNAVAGGNEDTFGRVTLALGQVSAAGKLTAEDWNQISDAIPTGAGQLQKALEEAGAYTGNFREAMRDGEIGADELNAAIAKIGSDPIAQEAATSVETMEGAVGNLSASITGVLADAFTAIKPFLTDFIAVVADFIGNSDLFVPVIGGLAAALLVALAPAIWAAVTATWAFTTALLANPLTWVVLAVAALVAAIIWMAQNWDQVTAWVTEVWSGFMGWITGVIDGFVGWWNGIWAQVGAFIGAVWNTIVATVRGVWNGFWGWVVGAVGGFLGWWNGIWKAVGDTWNNIWSGMGSFVSGIWNGIVNGIRGYINTLIGLINGIIDGVNVLIGGAGAVIGLDVQIPRIPKLAQGGIVSASAGGTLAVIGEGGRDEAVIPLPDDWRQNGFGGSGITRDDLRRFAGDIVAGIQGLRSHDARVAEGVRIRGYDGRF